MKQTNHPDPFNLNRFLGAQESYYQTALQEIRNGCKDSHWIWFIFPQMKGLGYSPAAQNYGITSLNEARAYLANPTLRKHLIEISETLLQHKDMTAFEILGTTDAIKVRSCMTLFDIVEPNSVFEQVLECFYMGERDELTLQILQSMKKPDGRKKIVFLTGAGVSKESGIATFRDTQDGLWAKYDPMKLCSNVGFKENTQLVLDFYNMRRQKIYDAQPNDAHRIIAELEKDYDVTVITQNVDNLHERAGSSRVIHVHGELTKVTSSNNRLDYNCIREYPLNVPIKLGDKALDGSQLRSYVVFMDEYLSSLEVPIYEIQTAEIFVIVGTSMSIGAGAILAHKAEPSTVKYIIDPADHTSQLSPDFFWIQATATKGMKSFLEWEKIRLKLEKDLSEIPT